MKFLLHLFTLALAPLASAQILWDEAQDGELSNAAAGTQIGSLVLGSNRLIGSATPANEDGQDIFILNLPAGLTLDAVVLDAYSVTGGSNGGSGSFFAFERGSGITDVNSATTLLGTAAVTTDDIGMDLFPELNAGANFGGTGFTAPLAADTYTFWLRENSGTFDYALDFQTSAVPEPSALTLSALGLLGCFRRRR